MIPATDKIYRQKVDSQQGYEDWEYTGDAMETPLGTLYAFKNDLGVYWFSEKDLEEFKEETKMKIRYYVCGLGYDENDCVTDHEQSFGDFNTYEEAYELFVKLQCRSDESFFTKTPEVYQLLIQLEECEETDEAIECIDVRNEWWIENPNFKED